MGFVKKAFKAVVKAVTSVVKAVVKAVVNVVSSVVKFATQAFMGMLGGMPDLTNNAQATEQAQGVQIQRSGSVVGIPIIYGYRKVAGTTVFIESGPAPRNQYLWVSYVFSEGPVEGLQKMYIGDTDLDTGNTGDSIVARLNNGETVTITWGKYANRIKMRWMPGVYYSDPTTSTVGQTVMDDVFKDAPSFSKAMIYNGLATLFVRFEYLEIKTQADADANPWDGSVPTITVELLGKKVQRIVDPTSGNAVVSTTSSAYGISSNEYFSYNPAEQLLDYLRNPRYGKGLSVDDIHWQSWQQAARKCNQTVPFTSNISGPIHQLSPVISTDASIFNNVKLFLQQFRAYMPYIQGKYKLKIEDAGNADDILSGVATISATFDNDNIVGAVTYTGIDRSAKYNQVAVTYVDPNPQYKFTNQTVVYPETEAERQTYIQQDGGREYKMEITLPGITNWAIAKDMARLLFNKSRYQETCSLTVTSQAFDLEIGDNVYIQNTILNFADTPWRVVSMRYNDDATIELGCVRNPDFIYPHVRANEPDYVKPTYIPQGAGLYYPKNVEIKPTIGLLPPQKATLPTGTSTSSNPTTNPSPSNNTAGVNDTPAPAPTPTPLTDVIAISNITYKVINGQSYAVFSWVQPNVTMYDSVTIYVSPGTGSGGLSNIISTVVAVATSAVCDLKPGAGNTIEFQFPTALASQTYTLRTSLRYSTGQYSTVTTSQSFTVPAIPAPVTAPPATTTTTTTPATTPPATVTPPPTTTQPTTTTPPPVTSPPTGTTTTAPISNRAHYTNNHRANMTAGQSTSVPRQFNMYFDIVSPSSDVVGVTIFSRATTSDYWIRNKVTNSAGNVGTLDILFNVSTVWGNATNFEMVIRVAYSDGSESSKQVRFTYSLDNPSGSYPINPFYGRVNISAAMENSSAFNPQLFPPGAVVGGANIAMSIYSVNYSGTDGMMIKLWQPSLADKPYWLGQTIRYRPVIEGQDPDFVSYYDKTYWTTAMGPGGADLVTPIVRPIVYNQKYEVVVTPFVNNGTAKTDSLQSWYGVGYINNATSSAIYPADGNWNFNFNWQQVPTSQALKTIDVAFPPPVMANAVVQLTKFDTVLWNNWYSTSSYDNGTSFNLTSYHKVSYSATNITNFKQVNIYRRYNTGTFNTLAPSAGGAYALYNGLGRWEKITSVASSGNLNLRGPTASGEFFSYYQTTITSYAAADRGNLLTKSTSGGSIQYDGKMSNNHKVQIYPAGGANQEFLFVIQFNDDSLSNKGLLVKCSKTTSQTSTVVNQLTPNLPVEVNVSDYNLLSAGYQRNLNEARTLLGNVDIGLNSSQPSSNITGTEAGITKWVTYPTTNPTDGGSISPPIQ